MASGTLPNTLATYSHPHPNPRHVMGAYRRYLLGFKQQMNRKAVSQGRAPSKRVARGLIHYRPLLEEYLAAKRVVISAKQHSENHDAG